MDSPPDLCWVTMARPKKNPTIPRRLDDRSHDAAGHPEISWRFWNFRTWLAGIAMDLDVRPLSQYVANNHNLRQFYTSYAPAIAHLY